MTGKPLGRGAWIGYRVHDHGYDVTVYDSESREVEYYSAGNHARDSQVYVEKGDPDRLPKQTLQKFARQTAQDMAAEHGINLVMIQDESGE
jgi:hypothetical protein